MKGVCLLDIYIAFPDKCIMYNCFECPAVCCHVANQLVMNDYQYELIMRENPLLSSLAATDEKKKFLKVGKKCWFINDGLCTIHKKYGEEAKPISCQLYPINIRRISNEMIIAEYIPCPNFQASSEGKGISHVSVTKLVNKYLDDLQLPVRKFLRVNGNEVCISQERFASEKELRDTYPETFLQKPIEQIFSDLKEEQIEIASDFVWLYPQLRLSPYILNLSFDTSLNTISEFLSVVRTVARQEWGDGSKQNAYIALVDLFNREVIKQYY
jgi:Fe-S-cluster containining protein